MRIAPPGCLLHAVYQCTETITLDIVTTGPDGLNLCGSFGSNDESIQITFGPNVEVGSVCDLSYNSVGSFDDKIILAFGFLIRSNFLFSLSNSFSLPVIRF